MQKIQLKKNYKNKVKSSLTIGQMCKLKSNETERTQLISAQIVFEIKYKMRNPSTKM